MRPIFSPTDFIQIKGKTRWHIRISERIDSEFGIFKGKIINLDGHFIAYFGKTGNPIFVRVAYPIKGITPENATIPMLEILRSFEFL